jgi:lipopolysaccharide transport system permease protein
VSVDVLPPVAQPAAGTPQRPVRRIQPSRGLAPIDLGELWRYRHLLFYFMVRDIKSRYKQTFLGPIWAILRPFSSLIIFSVVFGGIAGIQSGSDVPYPLFVFPGVIVFAYFSSVLTGTASSLLGAGGLLSKVYFPKLYAPISAATVPLIDFTFSLTIVFGLFAYYQWWPSWQIVFLPAFLLLALLAGLSVGLWLSGVSVRYRDVQFLMPYLTQSLLYLTPIIYPVTLVPERYRWLLWLNPMTAVVEGFRWSLLGTDPPGAGAIVGSLAIGGVLTIGGLFYFRRTERTIVDLL